MRHLVDWGAEIIRVEPRGSAEGFGGARDGFDFVNLHRNEGSIALNLKDPDAHARRSSPRAEDAMVEEQVHRGAGDKGGQLLERRLRRECRLL